MFGTATQGGHDGFGSGTVFSINTDGTGFTALHQFSGNDGSDPEADLVLRSNRLYGTTRGGGSRGNGTVFAMNIDGTDFKTLHSFGATTEDGGFPVCALTLSGNALYGTTQGGGSSGGGTIFRINTDGTGYRTIYKFTSLQFVNIDLSTNADGAGPRAGLILFENALYGTASIGGAFGAGTVFSVSLEPVITASPKIILGEANIILSWPTSGTGFTLQSVTNLTLPVWTTVSAAPVVVNGLNTVTNPISGTQQFFRLSQ